MNSHETIHSLFEAKAADQPHNTAIIFDDDSITYRDLNERANQLAHFLIQQGITADEPVALCMERSVDMLVSMLAILKAGGAYVPLDPTYPEERLLFTLNDCNAALILIDAPVKKKLRHYPGMLIIPDKKIKKIKQQFKHNPEVKISPQNLAYIIYTSGSTGRPKGVLIEHRSVLNYGAWFAQHCHSESLTRIDFSSNYIFDMAVSVSILPLMLGQTVVLCSDTVKKTPGLYLQHLKKNRINLIKISPSYFKVLLHEAQHRRIALNGLKSILCGGENLSVADCRAWLVLYPEMLVHNEYGPTEATVGVTLHTIHRETVFSEEVNMPIGKPGPGMDLHILDHNQLPVAAGEMGELYIGGLCLARGYLNRPELNEKLFIKDPFSGKTQARLYKTGDLCRLTASETIECFGRLDNQIKIRGFRIEPGEIEKVISGFPGIAETTVLVREDRLDNRQLIAYCILQNSDSDADGFAQQLREYLCQHLPEHMIPSAFVKINEFALTANGKLDYSALPVPQFTRSQNYLPPRTALEKNLAEIWSEELDVKPIGLQDDFFTLGGHSLSAARIVSEINNRLQKNLTFSDLYQAPTIAGLSKILRRRKKTLKAVRVPAHFKTATKLPLSDFQFMLWISNTFEPKAKKLNTVGRKRMEGWLDSKALSFALKAALKRHEMLFCRPSRFYPTQCINKNLDFSIYEENLKNYTQQNSDSIVNDSMKELIHHHPWKKDSAMIKVRLFYLKNGVSELQIGLPHIISDEVCSNILFSTISGYYLLYNAAPDDERISVDTQYRKYLFSEQIYIKEYLERDIRFWKTYLGKVSLFNFPPAKVLNNMPKQHLPYSSFLQIPEETIQALQLFCTALHVSINDALCAALSLAIYNCSSIKQDKTVFLNIVKSTRDNPSYDDTVGCFLKLESIKIDLNQQASLCNVSEQVQQAKIKTSHYQQCPSLVKLTCLKTFQKAKKGLLSYLLKSLTFIYTKVFFLSHLNYKILKHCLGLASFERENNFLININIQNNFITHKKLEETLFGLKLKKLPINTDDVLKIDNLFDTCFTRDDFNNHWLIISTNLKPEFRVEIGMEILRLISETRKMEQFSNINN